MFCQECPKKPLCTEVCKELNNYLEREQSKEGYSSRHIRRKEMPFSNDVIAEIKHNNKGPEWEKAGGGWRKKRINVSENY